MVWTHTAVMHSLVAYSSGWTYKVFMNTQKRTFIGLVSLALLGASFLPLTAMAGDDQKESASMIQSVQPDYVVELFTSQGCSSCPPANRFVSDLAADQQNALVLSYGVTYWDYLGWKDTFGDPAFSERQRKYVKSLGAQNAYTPQIILNGSAHSPRYSRSDIVSMPLPTKRPTASLGIRNDGQLFIKADLAKGHKISLIRYTPGLQNVDVKRGENGGRTLEIKNVVIDVQTLTWSGTDISLPANLEVGESFAALFHAPDSSKIVTAAVLTLENT